MREDISLIASILNDILKNGILVFASTSNVDANDRITFPARIHGIFCVESTDIYDKESSFSSSFEGEEKYSALDEMVSAACPQSLSQKSEYDISKQTIRRDDTSTATLIAADIATLLIDFT